MTDETKSKRKSNVPALLAVLLLLICGHGLSVKSGLRERALRAAEKSQHIQGQPMDSPARVPSGAKRELPPNADLEAMSMSAPLPKGREGYLTLGFDQLSSYDFPINLDGSVGQLADGSAPVIPSTIQELDQQKVCLSGFMMPLDFAESKVKFFILNKNQLLCCYGQEPQINEYCIVVMETTAELYLDEPVTVYGTLRVGEVLEDGAVLCVYRISGESVEPMTE